MFTIVKIIHTLQLLEDVLDQFGDHQKVFKIHTLFPIFNEDMLVQFLEQRNVQFSERPKGAVLSRTFRQDVE